MRIRLDEKFYIEVDKYTYDLVEDTGRVTKETKKTKGNMPITIIHGHCSSLEQAVKLYVRLKLMNDGEEISLMEYVKLHNDKLDEVRKELDL